VKTIGLLGGMSWESTALYYSIINETVKQRLGGLHSAKLCLVSVDFAEIESLQHRDRWDEAAAALVAAAQSVERGGADCLVICTNTMHKVAGDVEAGIGIPLLHIADATGWRLQNDGVGSVALLGTRFTTEEPFYRDRLADGFGLEVLTPDRGGREAMHRVIYEELCLGVADPSSRDTVLGIIDELRAAGAEAVILGCTEITMLIKPEHTAMPLYDTTRIHAEAAVDWALAA
jgi:aspartate racemase